MLTKRLKAAVSLIALIGGGGAASAAAAQECREQRMLTDDSEIVAQMVSWDMAQALMSYRLSDAGKTVVIGVLDNMSMGETTDMFSPSFGQASIIVSPETGWGDTSTNLLTVAADGAEFLAWDYEEMATEEAPLTPDSIIANAVLAGRSFEVRVEQSDGSSIKHTFRFAPSLVMADASIATNAALELKASYDAGTCTIAVSDYGYAPSCFLTTASVGVVGLADDCWELRTLRGFRDGFLSRFESGRELVEDYYARAPRIVERISARADGRAIWLKTYFGGILPSAVAARLGLNGLALTLYRRMTERLETLAA